jgi:acetyl-CoA C-acetyltransferase
VVADPGASFALPEVKVGLIAAAGGVVRLPRQLQEKLAMEMLLTGSPISAAKAAELSVVNRISEPGQVLQKARELAAELVAVSPTSIRLTMQLAEQSDRIPSEVVAAAQWSNVIDELVFSEDMAEGLLAFGQKRPPVWKNR